MSLTSSQDTFRRAVTLTMALLLLSSIVVLAVSYPSFGSPLTRKSDDKITVMTRNLYQGVDLRPLATATNATQFFKAVGAAYNRMQATDFPESRGTS